MPITINPTTLRYKNGNTFTSADCLKGDPADISIVAPDYSDLTFPVTTGKLCTHNNGLFKANQDIQAAEVWTAAHWTATTVEDELGNGGDMVVPVFTEQDNYSVACNMTYEEIYSAIENRKCCFAIFNMNTNPLYAYPEPAIFAIPVQFYDDYGIIFGFSTVGFYGQAIMITIVCYDTDDFFPSVITVDISGTPRISDMTSGSTKTTWLYPLPMIYAFGEKTSITVTFASNTPDVTEFKFLFTCPSNDVTTLTMNGINNLTRVGDSTLQAGHSYLVDVIGTTAIFKDLGVAT